jgi:hypothetical protein
VTPPPPRQGAHDQPAPLTCIMQSSILPP